MKTTNKLINVIFMGTPQISVKVLETIVNLPNVNLKAVICQPDKQLNRKKEVVFSPVKNYCLHNNIHLLQPNKIGDVYDQLITLDLDLIITCAYGQFIPQKILDLPKIGAFNLHASILPKLRGGAPIHWAIINNEHETGVTLMEMVAKMDAGNIVAVQKCPILKNETTKTLTEKLSIIAGELLMSQWDKLCTNQYNSVVQNKNEVSFGYNIQKENTIINFNQPAQNIECLVRGLYDKPLAIWIYQDIHIKIHQAQISECKSNLLPGQISKINSSGIYVATQDYDIIFTQIQLPNKKALHVKQIINGNHIFKV